MNSNSKTRYVSKKYLIRAIRSFSKALGASEESIYATAFILMLHNVIENIMEDIIIYINHNPYMDEDNFKNKIIRKMIFKRKVDAIEKYIPKQTYKKLVKYNELRNKHAHEIIDIGRSKWKQISRKEMNRYLGAYDDILHELGPMRRKAQKQYFEHSDILDNAYGVL